MSYLLRNALYLLGVAGLATAGALAVKQEPRPKIVIAEVKLEGVTQLPIPLQERFIALLKSRQFEAESKWIDEVQVEARGVWQEEGYFTVQVRVDAHLVSEDSTQHRFALTLHVEEGLQYRLTEIQIKNAEGDEATAFPREELRKLIPLKDGEIFKVAKIREGLDALRKFYGARGYIDFTAAPLTEVDQVSQEILLRLELDEQTQFYVGRIVILGMDPSKQKLLKLKLKPGDVYNAPLLDDFFEDNKRILPAGASPADVSVERDLRTGLVFLTFDFRRDAPP